MPKTIAEKIWEMHSVRDLNDRETLLYIDMHLMHEINTPQAFDNLRSKGLPVRRPELTLATEDHNTPTQSEAQLYNEPTVLKQVELLRKNCAQYAIPIMSLGSEGQGISHVIAPEQGRVLPGSTLVCCDSHTTTHGAFGALAFGIGTSQVEHVLATQTLRATKFKTLCVSVINQLPADVSAKDLALHIIHQIGTGGGQGHVIEYRGDAIRNLSMEARMTLCNMTVEGGASAGIISPDETTIAYLRRAIEERGGCVSDVDCERWLSFATDAAASFDKVVEVDASKVEPMITWGTNPSQATSVYSEVPHISDDWEDSRQLAARKALDYMQLEEGKALQSVAVDTVFVGSCTNGRIEDLQVVAEILNGRQVHKNVDMIIVPGSRQVYQQALAKGYDRIFAQSGADFRPLPGCSMCVGLNADRISGKRRTVSTSNRNFEGRQGPGVMTHIASPAIAAATAIAGCISGPKSLEEVAV